MDRRMLLTFPAGLSLTSVYYYRIATRCSGWPGQGAASPSDDAGGEHHLFTSCSRLSVVALTLFAREIIRQGSGQGPQRAWPRGHADCSVVEI